MYSQSQSHRSPTSLLFLVAALAQQAQNMGILNTTYNNRQRKIPFVTLALILICTIVHYTPHRGLASFLSLSRVSSLSISSVCLQPLNIIFNNEWYRIFSSAFFHANDLHLYYNMASLLVKGVPLEDRYGSPMFSLLCFLLLSLSHGLVVLFSWFASAYGLSDEPITMCAVGISALIFALKTLLYLRQSGEGQEQVAVGGFTVSTRYAVWFELVIIQLLSPANVSFLGHLCGIIAGLLFHVAEAKYYERGYRGDLGGSVISASLFQLRNAFAAIRTPFDMIISRISGSASSAPYNPYAPSRYGSGMSGYRIQPSPSPPSSSLSSSPSSSSSSPSFPLSLSSDVPISSSSSSPSPSSSASSSSSSSSSSSLSSSSVEFRSAMSNLVALGFHDRALNHRVLTECRANVEAAVEKLLAISENMNTTTRQQQQQQQQRKK